MAHAYFTVTSAPKECSKLTDANSIYKNCVLINPVDYAYFVEKGYDAYTINDRVFAQIDKGKDKSVVYPVSQDSRIVEGHIGLSLHQRFSIDAGVGDNVSFTKISKPKTDAELSVINFRVDIATRKSYVATIQAENIANCLYQYVNLYVTAKETTYLATHDGVSVKCYAENIELTKELQPWKHFSGGIITYNTQFTFYVNQESAKYLRIEGDQSFKGTSSRGQISHQIKNLDFTKMQVGGLDTQFNDIFRRAFASRCVSKNTMNKLGTKHVRGILLYGPPGTGKTLIARQIGKALNAREPKIVEGPEILNKYVGAAEENIRKLFLDAETEYQEKGDDSELHIIIFDEIDAICKQRGSVKSGTGVHDTIVNQLLTKMDGVDSLNNILIIGMTNRKEMLDEALLRPGRFEVQIEIGLPDERGRQQIFTIHTQQMEKSGKMSADVSIEELAALTKNYTGAEIEGVVKSAVSFAINRIIDFNNLSKQNSDDFEVTRDDFIRALDEVKPKFGVSSDEIDQMALNNIIDYGERYHDIVDTFKTLAEQLRTSTRTTTTSILLRGSEGSGVTTLACKLSIDTEFEFIRVVKADKLIGLNEMEKAIYIQRIFIDAYKSPTSVIILDDIERIIDFADSGPRFSNTVLQTLLVLLKKAPDCGRKLLVVGTTHNLNAVQTTRLDKTFFTTIEVPNLNWMEKSIVLESLRLFSKKQLEKLALADTEVITNELPIKKFITIAEAAAQQGPRTRAIKNYFQKYCYE